MCQRAVALGAFDQLSVRHHVLIEQVVECEYPQAQTSRRDHRLDRVEWSASRDR